MGYTLLHISTLWSKTDCIFVRTALICYYKNLTCFTSGFSRSIHSNFDALGIDSHLRRTGADGDSQIEALSWNVTNISENQSPSQASPKVVLPCSSRKSNFCQWICSWHISVFGIVLWWIVFSSRENRCMNTYVPVFNFSQLTKFCISLMSDFQTKMQKYKEIYLYWKSWTKKMTEFLTWFFYIIYKSI